MKSDSFEKMIRLSLAVCKTVGSGEIHKSGESNETWGKLAKNLEDAEQYYQNEEFTQKSNKAIKLIEEMMGKILPEIRDEKIAQIEIAVNQVLALYK